MRLSIGSPVVLKLKGKPDPLKGILKSYQSDHLVIKISMGSVTVPYVIMEDKTRLLYFPKEHAMYLYRQKYGRQ